MEKKPNILLVITDQQRRNSLGAYGCRYVNTPNLDALAQDGTRYDHAYCNAPICTPSRACLMTGKTLTGHGVYNLFDLLPENERLLPSYLKDQGYWTGLVGKLHVSGIMYECRKRNPGDGFDLYELSHEPSILLDEPYNAYSRWLLEHYPEEYQRLKKEGRYWKNRPAHSHFSTWVSQRTAQLIRERDKDKPFFLMAGYFDPHSPYDHHPLESEELLHEEFREPIVPCEEGGPEELEMVRRLQCQNPQTRFSQEKQEQLRRGYFAGISFLDAQFGAVIDALKEEGIYDDTLIIFTSDHGDMMCDHDLMGKGPYFYEDCPNVPLIVKYPGQTEGRVSDKLVQLNDLFATALWAAGDRESAPPDSVALQSDRKRDIAVCEYRGCGQMDLGMFPYPVQATMIRGPRYKLNLYHDTRELQLFDMEADPEELHDLSKDPAMQGVILELMQRYVQEKTATEYRQNNARGGLSEIPAFSTLRQRQKGNSDLVTG